MKSKGQKQQSQIIIGKDRREGKRRTFSDRGECRLKVNGEERDFWQVRRMALEELMFRGL